ncbi:DUF6931 family protein [Aporhodopirellula aestuarii]|uniref:FHA domain-containing protein n=1 Tax=Aporhodopirellula aestuarii TaxID=2950107 RepID=A0ABT0TZ70_9BACT|nr:hypothetical protein [Aporhodopirellula aestuarii]MCM2369870.1 hypothetical protein [Aporhodopirellula aestuarii]
MIALIQVVRGPGIGRRIQLRGGQRATIGGTDHADYRLADDRGLEAIHFEMDCRGGECRVIARANAPMLVNGQAVQEGRIMTGDTITVSRTTFAVTVEGAVETQHDEASEDLAAEATQIAAAMTMVDLCGHLDLDDDVTPIALRHEDVEPLIAELTETEMYFPALRLRANTLPRIHAVWWACVCVRNLESKLSMKTLDLAALEAAEHWVKDPSDETRRAAEAASEAAGGGAAGLIAYAAFTSGGGIGHPDVDPVEPDERLCGALVAGALMVAGYCDPPNVHSVMSEMLANGKEPWTQQFALPSCVAPS